MNLGLGISAVEDLAMGSLEAAEADRVHDK